MVPKGILHMEYMCYRTKILIRYSTRPTRRRPGHATRPTERRAGREAHGVARVARAQRGTYVQLTSNRSPVGGLRAVPAATPSPDNEAPDVELLGRRARGGTRAAGPVEVERRRGPGFRRVRGFGRYPLVASGLTVAHESRFCSPHPRFSAAAPVRRLPRTGREAGRLRIVTSTLTTRQPTEP